MSTSHYGAPDPTGSAIAESARLERRTTSGGALVGLLAAQDVILLAYLAVADALVARAQAGPTQTACAQKLVWSAALVLLGVVVARVLPRVPALLRGGVYRAALVGALILDYDMLRDLLPLIRPDAVDALLLRADLALFGLEPAVWAQRFNTRPIVEWFSCFYFSYYLLCAGYMVVITFLLREGRHTTEFAIGTLFLYSFAQIGYLAVPAVGPSVYLRPEFHGPVDGGFFWGAVTAMVQAGSPMKDVFPSMHTGGSTWFALFAVGLARHDRRFRVPAAVTCFIAANIAVSTLLLRWHYAVDVVAGLAFAFGGARFARWLAGAEERWREQRGLAPVWPKSPWFSRSR